MAKQPPGWLALQKRWVLPLLVGLSVSTALAFILRAAFDSTCDRQTLEVPEKRFHSAIQTATTPSPLSFMKSKLVLLVSHELSLSGGPLLLMELAFLLRGVGAEVCWITNQKPSEMDEIIYSLEHKMLDSGIQTFSAKGQEAVATALKADLVVLNTAVAGKWLNAVLKENVPRVLPKVLWWIHEMRGHYFKMEYVKHLPSVAGAMIDSHVTAEYWKNRTLERLKNCLWLLSLCRITMPETYVVHLGNSKELMEVAEDSIAKWVLRQHVRESLGVRNEDILFAIINSVSRGKGQDLFLRAFYDSLQLIQAKKLQGRGECFGRITIEAMAFQLPILGTSAGGTAEIVVNGSTGLLHPVGKEGVTPLAQNIVKLATHVERRLTMGKRGYERVKQMFLERHMAHRIAAVLKEVLQKAKSHKQS
ncbi:uncharacterized protein LOC127803428 isoform X3 [Diospyros lotus]|uniref:uncharacterized protein LOC127803428 isoform X3 n=1 Tax=Diospyros lotus TaxID=55363 RepID=UPI00224DDC72|nr:uncharacterized protein LOC127803428 isoform X3 [Diospyros lotus]